MTPGRSSGAIDIAHQGQEPSALAPHYPQIGQRGGTAWPVTANRQISGTFSQAMTSIPWIHSRLGRSLRLSYQASITYHCIPPGSRSLDLASY